MVETPQPQIEEQKESRKRFGVTWKSCLLLTVMVLGLVATPLAILYRLYREQRESLPLAIMEEGQSVNRIAFIDRDRQLATISPDGSNGRQLTGQNRRFDFPAWAPDGSRLAVTSGDSLYILFDEDRAADSLPPPIYQSREQRPFYLYWSPESDQVSFLTSHPEGLALYLANVDGSGESARLLEIGQPFYWDWTPSGNQILIHTGLTGDRARLALINPAVDGASEELAEPGFFQAPGISSSGRYRAFAERSDDNRSELVIQNDRGIAQVTEPHDGQVALTWSPTDELLAYSSPSVDSIHSYGPLRLLDPSTGESQTLTQANVLAFFWSPDGRKIAYLSLPLQPDGGIQAISYSATGQSEVVRMAQREELRFELWLVDVDSAEKRRLATFLPSGLFLSQFLPFFDQYALSHRLWSPNGDAIVLPMVENGVSHIAIVQIESGEIGILTVGEIGFWSHQ